MNNDNTKKIVEYKSDIMWFDYQALFDKTKSVVLEEDINISVAHTNFETNTLAKVVLGINSNYDELITHTIGGSIKAQCELFDKIGIYMRDHFIRDKNRYYIINYNYLNMMSIIAVLNDLDNTHAREMYRSRMRCDNIKKDFYMRNINKINFYNIITPLINTGFYICDD